ncbi:hypothetical protein BDV95DRAFT_481491 [Massariosphaeria phaeospora]|uniref:PIN domain-containing protein n=1 Tax=Massariosphaeria phaeospora TaxID=100035 RepID=A0A7C8MU05_9PLEO|nr:hypothetical protein BDV95DRAFT_481491 [Massariosphaeria phaeospora]
MRRMPFPVRAKAADAGQRALERPSRKVFNCIVDDTALMAGVRKSTRDGVRKWVAQGAIRLFVPLQTLSQLNRLKKGAERIHADAREALKWLDEITESAAADNIQLEGVEEVYDTWDQVEKFLLPETLLSMEDSESDDEYYQDDLESSFNALDVSDGTSMSSTHSLDDPPKTPESAQSACSVENPKPEADVPLQQEAAPVVLKSPDRTARNSAEIPREEVLPKSSAPAQLQPLFNHILWRIHKESNPDAALESFILLTNDPAKQAIAQKFGIRAKRLEQLRDAVAREDREYKNHLAMYKMESECRVSNVKPATEQPAADRPKSSHSNSSKTEPDSDDEDVVLLKRAPRGPQAQTESNGRVWDPNDFGRANQRPSPRGARGGHGAPRGRGGPTRGGRAGFAPRGGAYVPPGPSFRAPPAPRHDPNRPLDPDSFARPTPRASPMRGARRKLWEPN